MPHSRPQPPTPGRRTVEEVWVGVAGQAVEVKDAQQVVEPAGGGEKGCKEVKGLRRGCQEAGRRSFIRRDVHTQHAPQHPQSSQQASAAQHRRSGVERSLAVRVAADCELGAGGHVDVHQRGQRLEDGLRLHARPGRRHRVARLMWSAAATSKGSALSAARLQLGPECGSTAAQAHVLVCSTGGKGAARPTCRMISNAYRLWMSCSSLNACSMPCTNSSVTRSWPLSSAAGQAGPGGQGGG